jgi:hypothetical protein
LLAVYPPMSFESLPSMRALAFMAPKDSDTFGAIKRVWFDGDNLRVLIRVGTLRRELKLLGFEAQLAHFLAREIEGAFRALGTEQQVRFSLTLSKLKVRKGRRVLTITKGKYWVRKMDRETDGEKIGCLGWLCMD